MKKMLEYSSLMNYNVDECIIHRRKMMQDKRIAIFGGTFSPIHFGHLLIAEQVAKQYKLNSVLFMPAGQPPHKENDNLLEAKHRLEMIKLAIGNNKKFAYSAYEINKEGKSYTAETLKHFLDLGIAKEVFFIIGADSLLDIFNWRQSSYLLENASFIVASRPGFDLNHIMEDERYKPYKEKIKIIKTVFVDHSSTRIREWIREKKSIRYQIPEAVRKYIIKNKLYRG